MHPALVLLEFTSIAAGIQAADAMAKRAPLENLALGTVHPGKFLVAAGGEVANVEEAWMIGRDLGGSALAGEIFLPDVHPGIVAAFSRASRDFTNDSVGVIETTSVAATLHATDRALKGTNVTLGEFRLADGLGGKGYALLSGEVGEVNAAVELAIEVIRSDQLVAHVVIPQLHADVVRNLSTAPGFSQHWLPQTVRTTVSRKKTSRKRTPRRTGTGRPNR